MEKETTKLTRSELQVPITRRKRKGMKNTAKVERKNRVDKELTCKICKITYTRFSSLIRHNEKIHKEKIFKCKFCEKTFFTARELKTHKKNFGHDEEIKIQYEKISIKKEPEKNFLVAQIEMVKPIKLEDETKKKKIIYICDHCGLKYLTKPGLAKHMSQLHLGWKQRLFECDLCGKKYLQKDRLIRHARVHIRKKIPKQCKICFKIVNVINFKSHMDYYHRPGTFRCETCGLSFKNIGILKGHLVSHTDKKHKCSICGRKFRFAKALIGHSKKHEENREKFPCNQCDKIFYTKANLSNHLRTHLDSRICQNRCTKCGFKTNHLTKDHDRKFPNGIGAPVLKVQEKIPKIFTCDFEGKTFKRKSAIEAHGSSYDDTHERQLSILQ